jgi:hypothetical protein
MVDVKVCGKCGTSIPGQAIIEGKARLINGQLLCAECAVAPPSGPAARPQEAAISLAEDEGPATQAADAEAALSVEGTAGGGGGEEITIFGGAAAQHRTELKFKREPTKSGTGAIRVKTFDAKLSRAAFEVLDEQINLWLDETNYEVKHVTTNIGEIHGKTASEPHLIISIWY